jgi:hypothetical protein
MPNPGKGDMWARVCSKSRKELVPYQKLLYVGRRKMITEEYLSHLNAESLAWWWMDDGSISSKGAAGNLGTNAYEKSQVELVGEWLLAKWDIETALQLDKRSKGPNGEDGTWSLRLKAVPLSNLSDVIREYVFPCMSYKLTESRDVECSICGQKTVMKKRGSIPCCSSDDCQLAKRRQVNLLASRKYQRSKRSTT